MATVTYDILIRDPDGTIRRETVTKTVPDPTPEERNEAALTAALGDSAVFDNLRTIANGSGTFATAAVRDMAIRTCARALVILIRLKLKRLDEVD